jgi:cytochrome c biogenesis protein CcmG/thiol:disulfide interchange protein DsbE
VCRAEAPEIEQLARDHGDELKVVGLGTQDSLPEAKEFQEEFDLTSTELLWEDGFDSWQALGISAQPAGILLDADGEVVRSWQGPVSPDEVLAAP